MIIETEPSGLMMIRYKFYFNQQNADPEDPWVLAYFQEHGLEPRRELHEEHEGIPYKVFHFGQCYLGRHVTELSTLYQRGIEHTVLAQHLIDLLDHTVQREQVEDPLPLVAVDDVDELGVLPDQDGAVAGDDDTPRAGTVQPPLDRCPDEQR